MRHRRSVPTALISSSLTRDERKGVKKMREGIFRVGLDSARAGGHCLIESVQTRIRISEPRMRLRCIRVELQCPPEQYERLVEIFTAGAMYESEGEYASQPRIRQCMIWV